MMTNEGTPPVLAPPSELRRLISENVALRADKRRLAGRIEKLSWMLEWMEDQFDWDPAIEDAEEAWGKRVTRSKAVLSGGTGT